MKEYNSFLLFICTSVISIIVGIVLYVITYFNKDIWGTGTEGMITKFLVAGAMACSIIQIFSWLLLIGITLIWNYLDKKKETKNPGGIV